MEAKNVDDILVNNMQQDQQPVNNVPQEQVSEPIPEAAESQTQETYSEPSQEQPQQEPVQAQQEPQQEDNSIDEYGNPVSPPKMYSQEEVQAMIRDRLSRGRFAEAEAQELQRQAPQKTQEGEDAEDLQEQLNRLIDQRLEEKQRALAEQEWRNREAQKQVEFESRFTSSMEKYPDFRNVVGNKPITDNMMLSIRGLDNPAAFLYGACKIHPQEVERIAKIQDPYQQASEMGRLHERMVKDRKAVSNAGRPLNAPKSDIAAKKINDQPSIDQRINDYGVKKQQRRG